MHYDNIAVKSQQRLTLVVYNHETSFKPRNNKYGFLMRNCVHYEVASIRECSFFPPHLLRQILEEPYDFFNEVLSGKPFDHWFLVTLYTSEKGHNLKPVKAEDVVDVTDRKDDDTLFLH